MVLPLGRHCLTAVRRRSMRCRQYLHSFLCGGLLRRVGVLDPVIGELRGVYFLRLARRCAAEQHDCQPGNAEPHSFDFNTLWKFIAILLPYPELDRLTWRLTGSVQVRQKRGKPFIPFGGSGEQAGVYFGGRSLRVLSPIRKRASVLFCCCRRHTREQDHDRQNQAQPTNLGNPRGTGAVAMIAPAS
jgi:hypothetical protein